MGEHGMGSNCTGVDGTSVVLQVPVGTALYDQETGELVHDFSLPDERLVIAKGGGGGVATSILPLAHTKLPASTSWGVRERSAAIGWS